MNFSFAKILKILRPQIKSSTTELTLFEGLRSRPRKGGWEIQTLLYFWLVANSLVQE